MNEHVLVDRPHFFGPSADFVMREIARVGAPSEELREALAFVDGAARHDQRAYDALSPRMRRLVDLVIVAGPRVSLSLCETADPKAA